MCLLLLFNEAQLIYHLKATVWGCNSLLDNCAKQWHQFFLYKCMYSYMYVLHSEEAVLMLIVSALISVRAFFKCAPRRKLSQVGSPLCACLHSSRLSLCEAAGCSTLNVPSKDASQRQQQPDVPCAPLPCQLRNTIECACTARTEGTKKCQREWTKRWNYCSENLCN